MTTTNIKNRKAFAYIPFKFCKGSKFMKKIILYSTNNVVCERYISTLWLSLPSYDLGNASYTQVGKNIKLQIWRQTVWLHICICFLGDLKLKLLWTGIYIDELHLINLPSGYNVLLAYNKLLYIMVHTPTSKVYN